MVKKKDRKVAVKAWLTFQNGSLLEDEKTYSAGQWKFFQGWVENLKSYGGLGSIELTVGGKHISYDDVLKLLYEAPDTSKWGTLKE